MRSGVLFSIVFALPAIGTFVPSFAAPSTSATPPPIRTLLKPEVYRRVTAMDRDIVTSADLSDAPARPGYKDYFLYGVMLVRTSLRQTREVLTNYPLYAKMIPYVDRSDFDPGKKILNVAGGIWKFKMASSVAFEEKSDRWIHYRIVGGSFVGMEGDMMFEDAGEKGTLVYIQAKNQAKEWPPALVVEKGAEIVFGFAGKKMRSFIEDLKTASPVPVPGTSPASLPVPRSGRLRSEP